MKLQDTPFDKLREQFKCKHACASVWMNTPQLTVSFVPALVLSIGAYREYSRLFQTGIFQLLPELSVWAQLYSIHPDLSLFKKYFQNGFQFKFFIL